MHNSTLCVLKKKMSSLIYQAVGQESFNSLLPSEELQTNLTCGALHELLLRVGSGDLIPRTNTIHQLCGPGQETSSESLCLNLKNWDFTCIVKRHAMNY